MCARMLSILDYGSKHCNSAKNSKWHKKERVSVWVCERENRKERKRNHTGHPSTTPTFHNIFWSSFHSGHPSTTPALLPQSTTLYNKTSLKKDSICVPEYKKTRTYFFFATFLNKYNVVPEYVLVQASLELVGPSKCLHWLLVIDIKRPTVRRC